MKSKSAKPHINSKSGFQDPLEVKSKNMIQEFEPKDGVNSPWDFRCPPYDQRHSNFVKAGTSYGVGVKQPVGHDGSPKHRVERLPYGRVETMRVDEV